ETPDPVTCRKRNALDAGLDDDDLPPTKRLRQGEPNGMQDCLHATMTRSEPPPQEQTPAQDKSADAYSAAKEQVPRQPEKMALDLPFILPNAIDADMQLIQAWLKTPGFDVNASYLKQSNIDLFVDAFVGCLAALIPNWPDGPIQKEGVHKTPLTLAIENSHFEMIHALLAVPGIVVSPDQAHDLFTLAAEEGDLFLLRLMLDRPDTDVNKRVDYSCPYLVLAAENGHLPIVHALLAVPGIDVNARGREIKNALHVAIQNNHSQIAMALVAMPEININALSGGWGFSYSYPGYTSLMMAAEKGNLALVRTLLAAETIEMNSNGCHLNGYTPLMLAAYQGHLEIVQALLAMPGIDISSYSLYVPVNGDTYNHGLSSYEPSFTSGDFFSALRLATSKKHKQIVGALLAMPGAVRDKNYHLYASMHANWHLPNFEPGDLYTVNPEETLREILYPGTVSNTTTAAMSPQQAQLDVQRASWLEQKCMAISLGTCPASDVRFLLQSTTPLPVWCRSSLANAIALGFTVGHYRNAPTQLRQVLLQTEAWLGGFFLGAKEARQNAIELDAGISQQLDAMGLWYGFLSTMEDLQQIKADPDGARIDKLTLLGRAARGGDLPMIKILVELGANIHLRSPNGDVPIVAAAKAGQWPACAELLSLGAMPVMGDNKGYPALYYIANAFAHPDTATPALAKLIRYLRMKNIRFDIPAPNPDEQDRKKNPTVLISDILLSNPESWVVFGKVIYGIDEEPLPALAIAPTPQSQQPTSSKTQVHAMFQSANAEAALAAWLDAEPQHLHWRDPDNDQTLLHLATASQNIGLVQFLLNRGIARTQVDRAGQTAAQLLPADYMSSYTPAAKTIANLLR
ncbi:MAG: hypothetical protein JWM30_1193, partial [Burkholderia sp.]|nr:hypothetical protein [Burkholderia sp.]